MNFRLFRIMVAYALFSVPEIAIWVGLLIFLYDRGGASAAGLIGGLSLVPAILISPLVSTFGDRMPRGQAIFIGYAVTALLYSVVAWVWAAGAPTFVVALAFSLLYIAMSATRPVHYAIVPQLAETPEGLVRANSVTIFIASAGMFIGPLVAGWLHDRGGATAVAVFCAICLGLAAVSCLGLHLPAGDDEETDAADAISAGLRYVWSSPRVRTLVLVSGLLFLAASAMDVLGVTFAASVLNTSSTGQGILVAAVGFGGLIGAAAGSALAGKPRLAQMMGFAFALVGLPLIAVTFSRSLWLAALLCGLSGAAGALVALANDTLLQRCAADDVLARVFAVSESAMLIGYVIGAFGVPALVAFVGPAPSYAVLGGLLCLVAAAIWPSLRQIDRTQHLPEEIIELLRKIPFLASMRPSGLERLAQSATWVPVVAGERVISEGDHGDAFFIVKDGRLDVSTADAGHRRALTAGEGFGEIALLLDVPRTATVTAEEDAQLLRIERDDFLAAVTRSQDGHRVAREVAAAHLSS